MAILERIRARFTRPSTVIGVSALDLVRARIAWGKAYGETAGLWYRVRFPKPLSNPSVIAVGEARLGTMPIRRIEKLKFPIVEAPPFKDIPRTDLTWWKCNSCGYAWLRAKGLRQYECPNCRSTNITVTDNEDAVKSLYWWAARTALGDWGIFNWMRDAIILCFQWIGMATARLLLALWRITQHQIDYTRDRINEALRDSYNKLVSQAEEIQATFQAQLDRITDAINLRLEDLYDFWGLPKTVKVTPIHVRNVTETGFEWQSLGETTIYWFAIGGRR